MSCLLVRCLLWTNQLCGWGWGVNGVKHNHLKLLLRFSPAGLLEMRDNVNDLFTIEWNIKLTLCCDKTKSQIPWASLAAQLVGKKRARNRVGLGLGTSCQQDSLSQGYPELLAMCCIQRGSWQPAWQDGMVPGDGIHRTRGGSSPPVNGNKS